MIGCIIQSRMGSTRFRGKILKKLDQNDTVLDYVINQVRNSKKLEKIVIATSELAEDDVLEKFSSERDIPCFRGSQDDVLDRHYQCAKQFSFATIVRVTSDNPLVDPEIIDLAIKKFKEGAYDMVTTCHVRSYPYGISVEVFSFDALEKSWINAKLPSEREHVVLYMINNKDKFKIHNLIHSENLTHINCTIDNENDFRLVKMVVDEIKNRPILMNDIAKLFRKKPELININKNSDPYEGHKKSFANDFRRNIT